MRIRRSRALAAFFDGNRIVVFNYMTKSEFQCSAEGLSILSQLTDWVTPKDICSRFMGFSLESVFREIMRLCDVTALVVEGTKIAILDEEYEKSWEFGPAAGIYHFGTQSPQWMNAEETISFLHQRRAAKPLPPAYTSNAALPWRMDLPVWDAREGINRVMFSRRSRRDFTSMPIGLKVLGDCLYSGLGISAVVESPIFGRVPLKVTPSGGARNPFEAYIYAFRVDGLDAGIYHYSGMEHSLGLVSSSGLPSPSELVAGQGWADQAAAIVFLVANFERTMWKYPAPNGYKVVMIEAGHIAQNIILSAVNAGIGVTPTCAFNETALRDALNLKKLTEAPIHSTVLGVPAAGHSAGEWWMDEGVDPTV